VRLVDVPADLVNDPRARNYIIDNLRPGTTVHRRVEVVNTSRSTVRVALYPGAAVIAHGAFTEAGGKTRDELSTWTRFDHGTLAVPGGGRARATVTIRIPRDAAPGERYAMLWAQVSGRRTGSGITLVNRVGIRVYLSVGGHNPPASDFTADSVTAARDRAGRAVLLARVHNTGGRALDLRGTLGLSKVTGSLRAGPYPVQLGTTLAPGQSEPVRVPITDQVADGPWNAALQLKSGPLEKTYRARITFPHGPGVAAPVKPQSMPERSQLGAIGAAAALLLVAGGSGFAVFRRRRT
jgi:hypothetical protein